MLLFWELAFLEETAASIFGICLLVIKCECSYKILLVSDLQAMSQAIEKHVLEHKNKCTDDAEAVRIEDALISQVFDKAAESKD